MESYNSSKSFAKCAGQLLRLDAVVLNAGIMLDNFHIAEQGEATVMINVTSSFLRAALLLLKIFLVIPLIEPSLTSTKTEDA